MTAEFHQRVRELFDRALEFPEQDRIKFLHGECGGDTALADAVERLLSARGAADGFMNTAAQPTRHMGRYHIRGEIGRGGMGIVYDAVDPVIGRSVALKVINLKTVTEAGEAEFMRERLFREARSCGQLFHPGIVIIFDVGQEEHSAFIAMERVDGPSLHQMLVSGPRIQGKEAIRILKETAAALDYAHQHGVVHRDIKPGNIMLRKDGTVKVGDFGIAKVISRQHTTSTGVIMGTPSYMSPEQIEGRQVDGRSDQFALAVLAYELLAGERPFQADSLPTMAHLIVYGLRPSARGVNPALPAGLDEIFQRGLARNPEHRFRNCVEFVNVLQTALETHTVAVAETVTMEKPRRAKRRGEERRSYAWLYFVGLAALVCAVLAAIPFIRYKLRGAPRATAAAVKPAAAKAPAVSEPAAAPLPLPVIKAFRADPDTVKTGIPVTLVWDVTGADSVSIDHGIGTVTAKGMSAVVPNVSTTYALTASGAAGSARRTASVNVQPDSVPPAVRAKQMYSDAMTKRRDGQLEEAAALLGQAAELGDTSAMVELGESYRSGDGVTQDEAKALSWFKKAADGGNSWGMVSVGVMYSLGWDGGDANDEEAAQWYQKAADKDNPSGMYDLAGAYEQGRGVRRSLEKAKELYEKAAALGSTDAQKRLAQLQGHK